MLLAPCIKTKICHYSVINKPHNGLKGRQSLWRRLMEFHGGEPIKMFSLRELTTSTGIIAVYYAENSPTIYVFEWRKMHFKFPAVL